MRGGSERSETVCEQIFELSEYSNSLSRILIFIFVFISNEKNEYYLNIPIFSMNNVNIFLLFKCAYNFFYCLHKIDKQILIIKNISTMLIDDK